MTFLFGRFEFDGGVGGVDWVGVQSFVSNSTSVEAKLGWVDIVVGIVTIFHCDRDLNRLTHTHPEPQNNLGSFYNHVY